MLTVQPDNSAESPLQVPPTTRDWVRAAVWIGGLVLSGLVALLVFYNQALCGCTTRAGG